jgi:hypothetical protein
MRAKRIPTKFAASFGNVQSCSGSIDAYSSMHITLWRHDKNGDCINDRDGGISITLHLSPWDVRTLAESLRKIVDEQQTQLDAVKAVVR